MIDNVISVYITILERLTAVNNMCKRKLDTLDVYVAKEYDLCDDIREELETYKQRVRRSIECDDRLLFIAKTDPLIRNYHEIMKCPLDRELKSDLYQKKYDITRLFYEHVKDVVRKYGWNDISINVSIPSAKSAVTKESSSEAICSTCQIYGLNNFDVDDKTKSTTCCGCSNQVDRIETENTYQDYNRVNIVNKFVYNRILHFQDCIKQFQGKQNCKIPERIYSDLENKFGAYRLLIDSENYYVKHSKITPQHISMFLKELKYVKQYENVNVIYYTLTNKRVADIGYLEEKLIEDFKELVALYDSLHSKDKPQQLDRKNFMNVQYLLFQLLRRHGYPCKIEDFSILKTIDRKLFHDNICNNLFNKLGWNFTPTF